MAVGAASGALGCRLTDAGINDDFMRNYAAALAHGAAGLFPLVRKRTTDKVLADLQGLGGTGMHTSFDHTPGRRCCAMRWPIMRPRSKRHRQRREDIRVPSRCTTAPRGTGNPTTLGGNDGTPHQGDSS